MGYHKYRLHGFSYFTVMNISAAYWGVPFRNEDIEKTAFNAPKDLFEMTVMPFGLVNAQDTFQRLMDTALRGLEHVEAYIDDCIIYSHGFEQHLEDLRALFERLRAANLHVKMRNCQFFRREVEFLGHLVAKGGRKPLVSAAMKLSKFPKPTTITELQRFLGSINFYRSYIPNMAQLAAPLYELTRKGSKFVWCHLCDEAFDTLRQKLFREPIMLAFPNWGRILSLKRMLVRGRWQQYYHREMELRDGCIQLISFHHP